MCFINTITGLYPQGKCSLYDNYRTKQRTKVSQLHFEYRSFPTKCWDFCHPLFTVLEIGILFGAAAPGEAVSQFGIPSPLEEESPFPLPHPIISHLPCCLLAVSSRCLPCARSWDSTSDYLIQKFSRQLTHQKTKTGLGKCLMRLELPQGRLGQHHKFP